MRNAVIALCTLIVVVAMPAPASAWGFAAHRFIAAKAIELLPPALKPFFERHRAEIVERAVDPDRWRTVGWEDDPNHFVDLGDPLLGPYPFTGLPREYGAAIEKFGTSALRRIGLLPWREAEEFGNLRRAFDEFHRTEPYTASNAVLFAAIACHYIADAHQPFHATNNFDGQLTGSNGIHSRFERDLWERFEARLRIAPAPPVPITNVRDRVFDVLLDSYQLVDPILKADKAAVMGKTEYDADYYEKFFTSVQPILEKQVNLSIAATASVWIGAWEQAGKPTLRLEDVRPVLKVR